MEYGITIPFQNYLSLKKPAYGEEKDLFFCWEVHVITLQGVKTLIAVNACNCYTVAAAGIKKNDWENFTGLLDRLIRKAFLKEGLKEKQIDSYFRLAGETSVTKTHGRRPVAGLNRMTEFFVFAPAEVKKGQVYQEFHCRFANAMTCRAAGFPEAGIPLEFLKQDLERIGITLS